METLETTPGRCILTVAGKERESFEITEEENYLQGDAIYETQ